MRAPFQILVFPFVKEDGKYYYALFKRKDMDVWQAIAGGGEDNENSIEAMKREAYEEALINKEARYIKLASVATIPAVNIRGIQWGDIIMIPEITFGVEVASKELKISDEHTEYLWLTFDEAMDKLKYDSNKSALWELDYRLQNNLNDISNNIQTIEKYYSLN